MSGFVCQATAEKCVAWIYPLLDDNDIERYIYYLCCIKKIEACIIIVIILILLFIILYFKIKANNEVGIDDECDGNDFGENGIDVSNEEPSAKPVNPMPKKESGSEDEQTQILQMEVIDQSQSSREFLDNNELLYGVEVTKASKTRGTKTKLARSDINEPVLILQSDSTITINDIFFKYSNPATILNDNRIDLIYKYVDKQGKPIEYPKSFKLVKIQEPAKVKVMAETEILLVEKGILIISL